jgi:hypothetical protein
MTTSSLSGKKYRRERLSFAHLRLPEFGEIGADVEADSFGCSRKSEASYEQDGQQYVWKERSEVYHLQCNESDVLSSYSQWQQHTCL